MKKSVLCIEFLLFVVFNLLFSHQGHAQNEYAVLLFGGSGGERIDVPDSLYVKHEIAPMYITLRSIYDYNKNNIWVLNLDGTYNGSYKKHFDPYDYDIPSSRYLSASIENFTKTLDSLNSIISQKTAINFYSISADIRAAVKIPTGINFMAAGYWMKNSQIRLIRICWRMASIPIPDLFTL